MSYTICIGNAYPRTYTLNTGITDLKGKAAILLRNNQMTKQKIVHVKTWKVEQPVREVHVEVRKVEQPVRYVQVDYVKD